MSTAKKRPESGLSTVDPIWAQVRAEAEAVVAREPEIATFIYGNILNHDRLEDAVAHRIATRLDHQDVPADLINRAFSEALAATPALAETMRVDIGAVFDRDPACNRMIEPVLYFKGFHAIEAHRLAHWLWHSGRQDFAYYLQSRSSVVFQTDIHPAVRMGRGIFLDHATSLVIGGTAVIDDDVSLLQDVTLGGTGKETEDRHPKVRRGVLIGAGAKILGNIEIGEGARVAAGSVVLRPVPPHSTVAGVPARVVGVAGSDLPSRQMDHRLNDSLDDG
ncbi:MAG: serine O-acetyltransferase [Bauldia sp.]